MSERTAPALAEIDGLLPLLRALPSSRDRDEIVEIGEALRRAVAAFHMEAIRFRMHSMERLLKLLAGDVTPAARQKFEDVRHSLETAGFHTRSHAAP
jgi:hypothetical protein